MTHEQVNSMVESLQRIAAALTIMARDGARLDNDNDAAIESSPAIPKPPASGVKRTA